MGRRLTIAEAELRCPDMVKGQKYEGARAKYRFICQIHGDYWLSFNMHQQGRGCQKCGRQRTADSNRVSIREMENRCPDMVKGQLYKGVHAKYRFICEKHGKYEQDFHNHEAGHGCDMCGGTASYTIEEAEKRCLDMARGQEWKGAIASAKYWFVCERHGKYWQSFNGHQNGLRCPKCNRSRGEEALEKTVISIGIADYEVQRRFPNCRDKYMLPFDGASESLRVVFEYHGEQHYHPVKWFGGQAKFKQTQDRDRIKRNWALRNGWRLIVIPYRIKNIEGYLRNKLGNFTVATDLQIAA